MFVIMRALHEFKAGPPSQYGYCDPEEDIALMVGYLKRVDAMGWKDREVEKEKANAENASRKRGKRG